MVGQSVALTVRVRGANLDSEGAAPSCAFWAAGERVRVEPAAVVSVTQSLVHPLYSAQHSSAVTFSPSAFGP